VKSTEESEGVDWAKIWMFGIIENTSKSTKSTLREFLDECKLV
jgi:hypothetical protein